MIDVGYEAAGMLQDLELTDQEYAMFVALSVIKPGLYPCKVSSLKSFCAGSILYLKKQIAIGFPEYSTFLYIIYFTHCQINVTWSKESVTAITI